MSGYREGVDYSVARPSPEQLRAAGITFACRYLAYRPNRKVVTRAEIDALHQSSIGVVLNWEQATGDMLDGYEKGARHAQEALQQAREMGFPEDLPIYFSCDTNIAPSQLVSVRAYLRGCRDVLGYDRVGVYGQYSVIENVVGIECRWGWQTYAWSAGKISQKAHLYQYQNGVFIGSADCDRDRALKTNFGAWEAQTVLTPDEITRIADAVWNHKLGQGTPGYAGQLAETAEAFDWQASQTAAAEATAANNKAAEILEKLSGLSGLGGLTTDDRVAIQNLTEALTALNNRLATP